MTTTDNRRKSVSLPPEIIAEIRAEAARQDRPFSWVVQQAWKLSRERMMRFPGAPVPPKGA